MKGVRNYSDAVGGNPTGLITWNGDCIPCLDIKPGDTLNAVVYTIAERICELTSPQDLSSLDLECALKLFDNEEVGDRTITKVIKLLLSNDCGLKTLIDNLDKRIDNLDEDNLVLNLGCLAEKDVYGNNVPYTEESVLQSLLDGYCQLKDDFSSLSGRLTTLTNKVNNLNIPTSGEVTVTTTISGPKRVSLALVDVAKDYTDYKSIIGSPGQVQTAISRQTALMNSTMSSITGWITSPTTEAQYINNQGLLLQYLLSNVLDIRKTCCASSCDDINVGFITSFDDNTVVLQFTSGAGTYIPTGYTDSGSVLTITNQLGTSFRVPVQISQGGETEPIDLSIFTKGDTLDFNIDVKLVSDGNTCQRCINKEVKYSSSDCCVVTNTGISDVYIVYTSPITVAS